MDEATALYSRRELFLVSLRETIGVGSARKQSVPIRAIRG